MRIGKQSLASRLALFPLACALGTTVLLPTIACNHDDSGVRGGGSQGPGDAGEASDAGSGDAASDGDVDPSRNADPIDLDASSADPALDIAASWLYFDNGRPWVRVEFHADWPVPPAVYFWSCSVLLGTANAPVVTYTVQSLDGTRSDSADGLDASKVTFAPEPKGFRVLFAETALTFDNYGIECGVKKEKASSLAQDTSGSFLVTNKVENPFGP